MHCTECSLSSWNHLDPLYLTETVLVFVYIWVKFLWNAITKCFTYFYLFFNSEISIFQWSCIRPNNQGSFWSIVIIKQLPPNQQAWVAAHKSYFDLLPPAPKAEILETTFSFRNFWGVLWRFRVPVMSGNHFVTKRFQKWKYPLFN